MKTLMVRWILVAGFAFSLITQAQTADDPAGDGLPLRARSDRLDVYGAGMCHQCEWRPHQKVMAAGEQCGVSTDGNPRPGVFECGRSPSCDPVCNFIQCETP